MTKFKKATEDTTLFHQKSFRISSVATRKPFQMRFIMKSIPQIPHHQNYTEIHKNGIPLRPILSMVGTFNHALASYLGKILSSQRKSPTMCKDSFDLASILPRSQLHKCYLVS